MSSASGTRLAAGPVRPSVHVRWKKDLGDAGEAFDLRPRRDLANRRLWRERALRLVRIGTLLVGDAMAAAVSLGLVLLLHSDASGFQAWTALLPACILATWAAQASLRTYGAGRERLRFDRALAGGALAAGGFLLLGSLYPVAGLGPLEALLLAVALGLSCVATRQVAEWGARGLRAADLVRRSTLIVGAEREFERIAEQVALDSHIRLVGWATTRDSAGPSEALGSIEDLSALIERYDVQSVIISAELGPERFERVARCCLQHGSAVSVIPSTLARLPARISSRDLLGWPLLELEVPRLHLLQVIIKRGVDLVLAAGGVLVLAPVLASVAVAVRLDSPGPVLFRQRRLGLGGRPFTIYKFRTMHADAEDRLRGNEDLYCEYVDNDFKLPPAQDPRLTRLGPFLRESSLDELPQLFNVLRGDMSLVGPRPIVPDEIERYGGDAGTFLAVKPGITGQWQVNGRSHVGYPERANLDLRYIRNWSLAEDLRILLRTAKAVLRREGAF